MRNLMSTPRSLVLACAAVISVSLADAANASTYDYVFSAGPYSAVGTLTTGAASSGGFLITDMTGSFSQNGGVTEYTLTLAAAGTFSNSPSNDNILFYPGNPPYLDFNGLAFDANGDEWNVGYATAADGGDNAYFIVDASFNENLDGSFTVAPAVSATPLPATLPLFAGGLAMFGFLALRKKRLSCMLAV